MSLAAQFHAALASFAEIYTVDLAPKQVQVLVYCFNTSDEPFCYKVLESTYVDDRPYTRLSEYSHEETRNAYYAEYDQKKAVQFVKHAQLKINA